MFPFPGQQQQADLLFASVEIFGHIGNLFPEQKCSSGQKLKGGKTTAQVEDRVKKKERWLGSWTERKEYSHMEKEREMWKEDESERLLLLLEPVMGKI